MDIAKKAEPLLLRPVGKDYLWGGERLNLEFFKNIDMHPLAETWECSTHSDGVSMVASGEYAGLDLVSVLKKHPEYLGRFANPEGELPILVKLIDAQQKLSVQVHPDDEYAKNKENGQSGKNEMWYVLDAEPGAELVYGFSENITKEELKKHLECGTIEPLLNKVPVRKGDVFFIEAGTVHAIEAGILIAEIQQSSNLTYRLYDYNRTDANGKRRELHIQKSLDVANTVPIRNIRQERIAKRNGGFITEELCICKYFEVRWLSSDSEKECSAALFEPVHDTFQVLLCISGSGRLVFGEEKNLYFKKGDCIFVPADSGEIKLLGTAELLHIKV